MNTLKFQTARALTRMSVALVALVSLLVLGATSALHADAPYIDPADDAEHFGPPESPLFWSPEQKVAGFRNMHRLAPVRVIKAGPQPSALPEKPQDLDDVMLQTDGLSMTAAQYIKRKNVAGLLVLKDGAGMYERYALGNTPQSRWVSVSVTRAVVSMLFGAAIRDGYIESVDEKVTDYLPRLQGSAYDQASIADLLQMSSGVAWNEDYADPKSDVSSATWETLKLYEYLRDKPVAAPPGEKFNYNTAETNLAGTLLRAAIGNNLATYLSEKIWRPMGMQADAVWNLTEPGGGEFGGCCISATLRDYARIGLFAMQNGVLVDGTRVLPNDWMRQSTAPADSYAGYGYFWWLLGDGVYRASGIFGQGIYVNPEAGVVIAMHSARDAASRPEDTAWQVALFQALTDAVSEQ